MRRRSGGRGSRHEKAVVGAVFEIGFGCEQRQLILIRRAGPWAERFAVAALVAHVIDVNNLRHVDSGDRDRDVRAVRADFGTDFTDRRTGQTAVLFMNFDGWVIQDSTFQIDNMPHCLK